MFKAHHLAKILRIYYHKFSKWIGWTTVDPTIIETMAKHLAPPHANILLELEKHLKKENPHLDQLLTAKKLFERLPEYTKGGWCEFVADLEDLHARGILLWQPDDRVLISMIGSALARELSKRSMNDSK